MNISVITFYIQSHGKFKPSAFQPNPNPRNEMTLQIKLCLKLGDFLFNNCVSIWHAPSVYQICCWNSCSHCKSEVFLQYEPEYVSACLFCSSWILSKLDTTIGLSQPLLEQSANENNLKLDFGLSYSKILVYSLLQNQI